MRETRSLLLLLLTPIFYSQELSIQAQLNKLAQRVTSLENEGKTLKVRDEQ